MNWQQKQLGDIASIITGWTPPPRNTGNYGNEIPFVSPADLGDKKYIFNTKTKLSTQGAALCQIFPANTILYVCIGSTIGKCGIASTALTSNQQINAVIPAPNYCSEFLYYSLLNESQKIKSQAAEQAVPIINKSNFAATPINLPPLSEQIEIATALASIDALLAKLDQLIAKKRDIKQAAMQELLTGRRRLPGFSDTWKFRVLRDLLTQPATYGIVTAGNFQRTGIPMIRGGDIKNGSIGNEMPFVSEEKNFEYARTITQAGDVLICLVGYPGESAKVPEHLSGSNISRSAGLLRLLPQLDPDYLVCYLNSTAGRKNFLTPSAGSAQLVVNLKDLNLLKARFPEVPEQQAIASIQLDLDAEITTLEARREKTCLIKQGMMQELLSGRVRLI